METARQLGIHTDLRCLIQSLGKLLLDTLLSISIGEDVVLNALGALVCLADWLG